MPRTKVDDEQLLNALTQVFAQHGFEGASLSLMTQATGLERASLYHRFPQGKTQMAQAVLNHVGDYFASYLLAPLSEAGDPKARLRKTAKRLNTFYAGGDGSCLLDTLSLNADPSAIRAATGQLMQAWLGAFAHIAQESSISRAGARRRAQRALAQFQGSLILARATGDRKIFTQMLRELPTILLTSEND